MSENMTEYKSIYHSPLGDIYMFADEKGLTDLCFAGEPRAREFYSAGKCDKETERRHPDCQVLADAQRWLDTYFSGRDPGTLPPLHLIGTEFQITVWEKLLRIPFGESVTYGKLASDIAAARGSKMSAQAVGGAVSRNRIVVMIPCHRVLGAGGELTGFSAGVWRKKVLLRLEYIPFKNM